MRLELQSRRGVSGKGRGEGVAVWFPNMDRKSPGEAGLSLGHTLESPGQLYPGMMARLRPQRLQSRQAGSVPSVGHSCLDSPVILTCR